MLSQSVVPHGLDLLKGTAIRNSGILHPGTKVINPGRFSSLYTPSLPEPQHVWTQLLLLPLGLDPADSGDRARRKATAGILLVPRHHDGRNGGYHCIHSY